MSGGSLVAVVHTRDLHLVGVGSRKPGRERVDGDGCRGPGCRLGVGALPSTSLPAGTYYLVLVSGLAGQGANVYYAAGGASDGVYNQNTPGTPTATFGAFSTEPRQWSYRVRLGASGPPPVNTVLPAVSGTAQVGQTLSTTNGTWTNSPTGFTYQWQACSPGCSNISAATGQTYMPVAGDVGKTIQAVVTATNNNGSTPATSNQTAAVTECAAAREHGAAGGLGDSAAGTDADHQQRHLVEQPDRLRVPVGALQQWRHELQQHLRGDQPDLSARPRRCRGDDPGRGHRQQRRRPRQPRRLDPDRCCLVQHDPAAREHGAAGDHGDGPAGPDVELVDGHLDEQPDRLQLPVAALRQRRQQLQHDRRRDQPDLSARPGRCRRHDPGRGHRDKPGRPRQPRRLEPDRGSVGFRGWRIDVRRLGCGVVDGIAGVGLQVRYALSVVGHRDSDGVRVLCERRLLVAVVHTRDLLLVGVGSRKPGRERVDGDGCRGPGCRLGVGRRCRRPRCRPAPTTWCWCPGWRARAQTSTTRPAAPPTASTTKHARDTIGKLRSILHRAPPMELPRPARRVRPAAGEHGAAGGLGDGPGARRSRPRTGPGRTARPGSPTSGRRAVRAAATSRLRPARPMSRSRAMSARRSRWS